MSMQESKPRTPARNGKPTRLLNSIGPAIVIAAVVLGPGSILTSSKIGAQLGYSAVWALVLACLLMIAMVSLATRIGVSFSQTPCGEIAARIGRPAAALVGLVMFLIIATFQSSNNIAIAASLEAFGIESGKSIEILVIVATNVLVIAFLYASRNTYRIIESAMKVLVLMMVVAFMLNCVAAKPDVSQIAAGLIPNHPGKEHWLLLVALMGTTFSVAAAFYQAYLVREKSWTEADRQAGVVDSFVGIATLGGISLVIMLTSAASVLWRRTGCQARVRRRCRRPAQSVFWILGTIHFWHRHFCRGDQFLSGQCTYRGAHPGGWTWTGCKN